MMQKYWVALSVYINSISDHFSSSVAERNPTSQIEESMSEDSGRNEQRTAWNAEDKGEDLGEIVTQRPVEISEQEAVKIESEESEKKCGEGKVGLLQKKNDRILSLKLS